MAMAMVQGVALVITWVLFKTYAYMSTGNKKLISSDKTRFLIWNLPAIVTCPFHTAHCKAKCYARKAERNYPGCLPCRKRNYAFSKSELFEIVMIRFLHYVANLKKYKRAEHITVRIHESGDFYSVDYLRKWYNIAKACADIVNMDFDAYTKSVRYVWALYQEGYTDIVEVLGLRYSVWDDTSIDDIALASLLHMPIYTAYEKEAGLPAGYSKCDCADCGNCRQCYNGSDKKQNIACEIH